MAEWMNLPATEATDWTAWEFRAQFGRAYYERAVACGEYQSPTPPTFDTPQPWDAQDIAATDLGIQSLQKRTEDMIRYFVRGDGLASLEGLSAPPPPYPKSLFWADVGIPPEGRPAEDVCHVLTYDPSLYITPAVGDRYAVQSPATGGWEGHDGQIAEWNGSGWTFETPADQYAVSNAAATSRPYFYYRRNAAAGRWDTDPDFGWTRKHPREIARSTDDGEAGQRARLVGTGTNANPGWSRFLDVLAAPPETRVAAPPNTYWLGPYYGVQAGATGDWAGHGGQLAAWDAQAQAWTFTTPADGTQYVFNSYKEHDYPSRLLAYRNAAAWIKEGSAWHRCGDIYEYDPGGWAVAEDQDAPPDLVTEYGLAEPGDYMGPWLFNELQAALQHLHLVRAGTSIWGGEGNTLKEVGNSQWWPTWPEAQDDLLARWAAAAPPTPYTANWGAAWPHAWNVGESGFAGYLSRSCRRQRAEFSTAELAQKVDVGFYVIGDLPNHYTPPADSQFAPFGNPVALNSATCWQTLPAADWADVYISDLWAAAATNSPPAPPWAADPDTKSEMGYRLSQSFIVREHKVPDGFAYQ